MRVKRKSGFTLVEILIVVVILGILAAIVVPQFTDASTQAKTASLVSDLQTVRSQIQLYKIQHLDKLPTDGGLSFAAAMTTYTNQDGTAAAVQAPAYGVFGPYLQAIPDNPFVSLPVLGDSISVSGVSLATDAAGDGLSGWHFNNVTGTFQAQDALSTSGGTYHTSL